MLIKQEEFIKTIGNEIKITNYKMEELIKINNMEHKGFEYEIAKVYSKI